jgi:hypothetical protein
LEVAVLLKLTSILAISIFSFFAVNNSFADANLNHWAKICAPKYGFGPIVFSDESEAEYKRWVETMDADCRVNWYEAGQKPGNRGRPITKFRIVNRQCVYFGHLITYYAPCGKR